MYIILGNFGNHSLAVMQHLIEEQLSPLHFLYVETGWAAYEWSKRIQACMAYAKNKGVVVHVLKPKRSFEALVKERGQFPSQKFQWCASFLKGLPILEKLDELDFGCLAKIVSGKRQCDSRRFVHLPILEENNDLYQGRTCWHPLVQTDDEAFKALIARTGLSFLAHPALECSPCIHLSQTQLASMDVMACQRLLRLETAIQQTMFQAEPKAAQEASHAKSSLGLEQFDRGCGTAWCCGE